MYQVKNENDYCPGTVSDWLIFDINSAPFQLPVYHSENKLIINEMMSISY